MDLSPTTRREYKKPQGSFVSTQIHYLEAPNEINAVKMSILNDNPVKYQDGSKLIVTETLPELLDQGGTMGDRTT